MLVSARSRSTLSGGDDSIDPDAGPGGPALRPAMRDDHVDEGRE